MDIGTTVRCMPLHRSAERDGSALLSTCSNDEAPTLRARCPQRSLASAEQHDGQVAACTRACAFACNDTQQGRQPLP
ncbi:hypothetical protein XnspCFBP7698_19040 [Xanthomonas sp. CFBP 7698]|nr:hypothetical protein XnspCFBP7698_19040 [Xanthomonas sp. CFBP 7698]